MDNFLNWLSYFFDVAWHFNGMGHTESQLFFGLVIFFVLW